jgi:hypothetical protein
MVTADEFLFIEQLRNGNEAAFVLLIDRYHGAMLRLAKVYVAAQAVAEEVVQETWMAVLEGLHRHFPSYCNKSTIPEIVYQLAGILKGNPNPQLSRVAASRKRWV